MTTILTDERLYINSANFSCADLSSPGSGYTVYTLKYTEDVE